MEKTARRRWWKRIQIILLLYIIGGIAIHFLQDKILFRGKKLPADYRYRFSIPFQQVDLPVNTEKNLSIVQFTVPDSVRKGIVLYFHGNRENINRYAPMAPFFTRHGYEVWMLDYPGYGKTTGERREKILYEDARVLYSMAIGKVPAEKIIIYGKSLGSGIAAQLSSVRDCRRLILETPYYDLPAVFSRYAPIYPYSWILKYKLPTAQYLSYNRAPVTIFHGTSDGVVAYRNSLRLSNHFKSGDELISIPGGSHNNLFTYDLLTHKLDSILQLP